MQSVFVLHEKLAKDTLPCCDLSLSTVRLMNDGRFPWLILVPRRADLREIHALSARERHVLIDEIALVAQTLERATGAQKMNVGALGNLVPQLHIHVIARFAGDAAWPGPVWGVGQAAPYRNEERAPLLAKLAKAGLQPLA